ncbi:hypothetical protein QR680_012276 [Steinernema hermaphroditum]|uniref:Uncharacterized protein n=1 Tax=Steinernema hermaphroditum TaxID=289476 RepID=A0AA39I1I1_9BILA|nr:hypothetical protein QR680_012276 [Steinernema hermaphroditum]
MLLLARFLVDELRLLVEEDEGAQILEFRCLRVAIADAEFRRPPEALEDDHGEVVYLNKCIDPGKESLPSVYDYGRR